MKKIVILDLSKDKNLLVSDSLIFQISHGITKLKNCKIIKNNFFTENKYKKFKKKINTSLFKFYNFLKRKNLHSDIKTLEIFNQRNDKNQLFNKIFNLIEIIKYIKNKKIKNVEIITDDFTFYESYKSLNIKNIKIINLSKKKPLNFFLIYFLKTIFFHLKTLIIVLLVKIFHTNKILDKNNSDGCLSMFPIFFKNGKNYFYNKKLINFNFQITDETHLGNSFITNIKNIFKVNMLQNTISVESYINILFIFTNFFRSINNYRFIYHTNNSIFKIDNINISNQFRNLFFNSLLNLNKLNIYQSAFNKIFKKYRIKKFHYYMFEYNFGYYLSNLIRKISPHTILIGYQHGIYSERLMWQNFTKKINFRNFFPDKIICKYLYSYSAYKKNFNKIKIKLLEKNNKFFKNKSKKYKKNYLVYLGLHDCYNMINELRNLNKNVKFILNLHPKMKYKNLLNLNNNFIFNKNKKNYQNVIKLLSSSSTMPYQYYSKEKFAIIVPKNTMPLNPKIFDKLIFKST